MKKTNACTMSQQWKRLPWLLLIPLGLLLPRLAARYPWAAEAYAQTLYPWISGVLGAISGLFPFSLAEFLLYGLLLGAGGWLLATLLLTILRKRPLVKLVRLVLTLAILVGILLNAFYLVWGFNYARPTLYTLLDLPVQERPVEELETLCRELATEAASLREQVSQDADRVFSLPEGWRAGFSQLPDAYAALGAEVPLFSQPARTPKGVLLSQGMSWAGIAGIYIPFTAEANVNVHQPPLLLLSSGAHEMAHYLGFAREDEANFIAYLACIHSQDPSIAYSGVMLALIHCGNQLYKADPSAYLGVWEDCYSPGMIRDLRQYNAYWDSYEGQVEAVVDQINDSYLKHNQQESGVQSYGMMVDLLLAWRQAGKADAPA